MSTDPQTERDGWLKHDGGPKPVPDNTPVDLIWGFGIILGQNSDRVNWIFHWDYRLSSRGKKTDD